MNVNRNEPPKDNRFWIAALFFGMGLVSACFLAYTFYKPEKQICFFHVNKSETFIINCFDINDSVVCRKYPEYPLTPVTCQLSTAISPKS